MVHHDHLNVSQILIAKDEVIRQTHESGDILEVQNLPIPRQECRNDESGEVVRHTQPRVRGANLLAATCSVPCSVWLRLRYSIQKDVL